MVLSKMASAKVGSGKPAWVSNLRKVLIGVVMLQVGEPHSIKELRKIPIFGQPEITRPVFNLLAVPEYLC